MKTVFKLCLLALLSQGMPAQTNTRKPLTIYDTYPWQGQKGYNCGLTFYGRPGLDAGVMVSDLPRRGSGSYRFIKNGWILCNQNFFFNTELKADRHQHILVGPKAGYEINYVFFTGRLSDVCYMKPSARTIDNRLLLEGGVTLLGFVNLCYGYSLPTQVRTFEEIGRHRVTLRVNVFPSL